MAVTVDLVESVNHAVGYAVTLAGVLITAPDGTRDYLAKARRGGAAVLVFLHVLKRSDGPTLRPHRISVGTQFGWDVLSPDPNRDAPIDERVAELERRTIAAEKQLAELATKLRAETSNREAQFQKVTQQIAEQDRVVRAELETRDRENSRVDANGIPVVVAGTILTTSAASLAAAPPGPVALAWPLLAALLCARGLYAVFVRRRSSTGSDRAS